MDKVKLQIRKLAKEFDLKFKEKWFDYMWISKRDEIILQYIGNCADPVYKKYGNSQALRIRNIAGFFRDDLGKLSGRFGGEIFSSKDLSSKKNLINSIKDEGIKKEISRLLARIGNNLKGSSIALLTKTSIKSQRDYILRVILRHEWIHVLLYNNNLDFVKINAKFWMYDEGLCTYLEAFIDGDIDTLEANFKKIRYPHEKKYYFYALKYKKLLGSQTGPKERKRIISEFYKSKTK